MKGNSDRAYGYQNQIEKMYNQQHYMFDNMQILNAKLNMIDEKLNNLFEKIDDLSNEINEINKNKKEDVSMSDNSNRMFVYSNGNVKKVTRSKKPY